MLAEFSIFPLGKGTSVSAYVGRVLDIIDKSGLDYKLTPMGTIIEGDFKNVMSIIAKCHKAVLKDCERVITNIKIDDRKGVKGAISKKIKSVEKKVGRKLRK